MTTTVTTVTRRLQESDRLLESASWETRHMLRGTIPSIHRNLLFLGVDVYTMPRRWNGSPRGKGKNFWTNYEQHLPEILKLAHKGWRSRMKKFHSRLTELPRSHHSQDKRADTIKERMLLLNLCWERVEKMFAAHDVKLNGGSS